MKFVHINEEGICDITYESTEPVVADGIIEVFDDLNSYVGKRYENGEWSEVSQEPVQVVEPQTIEEQLTELQEQNFVLMDAMATIFETMLGGA